MRADRRAQQRAWRKAGRCTWCGRACGNKPGTDERYSLCPKHRGENEAARAARDAKAPPSALDVGHSTVCVATEGKCPFADCPRCSAIVAAVKARGAVATGGAWP